MMPGHWEGGLIKGKNNASVVEGFSSTLNRISLEARKTLTYDQGREPFSRKSREAL